MFSEYLKSENIHKNPITWSKSFMSTLHGDLRKQYDMKHQSKNITSPASNDMKHNTRDFIPIQISIVWIYKYT